MDAIKTLWERRKDAIGTLWGHCVHAITGNFDILNVFRGDPTARWQVFRTMYKRCVIAIWSDKGLATTQDKRSRQLRNLKFDYNNVPVQIREYTIKHKEMIGATTGAQFERWTVAFGWHKHFKECNITWNRYTYLFRPKVTYYGTIKIMTKYKNAV